jgi:hypothetical protein
MMILTLLATRVLSVLPATLIIMQIRTRAPAEGCARQAAGTGLGHVRSLSGTI